MVRSILLSLLFFSGMFILALPVQSQITVNSSGNVTFDNNVSVDNNTTLLGSVNIGTTSHNTSRLYIYNNQGGTSKTGIRAYTFGSGSVYHYGVQGIATGSSGIHRGLYAQASGGSSSNYGIYATASGSNNLAGYFNGDIYVTGSYGGSDQRLKKDIESLRDAGILAKIGELDPKSYQFLNEEELRSQRLPVLHASGGTHFGLLAQEVEEVFPELVRDIVSVLGEETGELPDDPELVTTKAINYQELTVLLLAAIQEQQEKIEELEVRLQAVENILQN